MAERPLEDRRRHARRVVHERRRHAGGDRAAQVPFRRLLLHVEPGRQRPALEGNARFLKSLFLDVDVKPGAFATPVEALQALNMFRGAVGLPRPTLVVMTAGLTGGFHCHWILDRPLAKDEWLPLAKALKEAVKQHKLAVDLGVIADLARLLRVPGTINHKYPDQPLVVLHPSIVERDYAVDEIAGPLQPYMNAYARESHDSAARCGRRRP